MKRLPTDGLANARRSLEKKRLEQTVLELKHQLGGYKTQLQTAQNKIQTLTQQLASALEEHSRSSILQTPRDLIWLDLVRNRDRPPNGRRYCMETLVWAREILDTSPHA
jgi:hypothetical protein